MSNSQLSHPNWWRRNARFLHLLLIAGFAWVTVCLWSIPGIGYIPSDHPLSTPVEVIHITVPQVSPSGLVLVAEIASTDWFRVVNASQFTRHTAECQTLHRFNFRFVPKAAVSECAQATRVTDDREWLQYDFYQGQYDQPQEIQVPYTEGSAIIIRRQLYPSINSPEETTKSNRTIIALVAFFLYLPTRAGLTALSNSKF